MKVASLIALSALALAAPTPEPEVTKVKLPLAERRQALKTRKDGEVDMQWLLGHLKYTLLKYNKDFELPELLQNLDTLIVKRDTDANEPLTDQTSGGEDELYVIPQSSIET